MQSGKRAAAQPRILLIEDDYLVSTQMEEALEEAGFEIAAVVASAEDAIRAAATQQIDLAVMDIRLAGKLDGVDGALELFSRHGIRCIFATAHSDTSVRARAEPAKPLGWLNKPYSMSSLVTMVRHGMKTLGR